MQQRLNTTLKRSSYQSIPEEDDDTSTGSSPLSTASASNSIAETLPKRQLRPYFLGAILLCLSGLIAVSIIHDDYYTLYMPTARERDVASAYDLPASLSTWNRIQKAQRLADISQSWHTNNSNNDKKNDNNDNAEDHEDVVQKINKKNGKDYVDVPDGCEATVMIVRHCEKGDIREHCDYLGFERSVYLAKQFGNSHEERWPAPSFIFAMSPGGRHNKHKMNYREIETVGPLAEKTGITVDDS